MRAVQIVGPGRIERVEIRAPGAVARAGPGGGASVRGVPDRPAPAGRRGLYPPSPDRARPPDRRHGRGDDGAAGRASGRRPGSRVGIPWLGWTCGECRYCRAGRENLCDRARFTGRDIDGGFAEFAVVDRRFCFPLPDTYGDLELAPLLCAGLIGFARCG